MGSHYSSRLVELASEISKQTTVVDDYLTAHGYELSFSTDRGLATFPADAPAKVLTARQRVCEATKELYDLTTGPAEHLRWLAWRYFDVSSLRLIYYFNIAELVPLDSMISFDQLAEDAQVPVRVLRPYLRQAMTNNLFSEPKPGYVSHTIGSSLLPKSKSVRDWIGYVTEEGWPSSLKAVEAIEKWGPREEPNRSPFNLAFDTSLPYFQYLSQHPHRAERFGGCMDALMKTDGYNIRHLVNGFAWDRLEPGSTVVDVCFPIEKQLFVTKCHRSVVLSVMRASRLGERQSTSISSSKICLRLLLRASYC
jgi:6-hydroxytryprostatin B O-methyltransferase